MAPRRRITLDQIAEAAEVSRATVSKALNGREDVAELTRQRVLEAARSLGYVLPLSPSGRTRVLTVALDTLESYYVNRVLAGVLSAAHDHGTVVDVRIFPDHEESRSATWVQRVVEAGHLGLITVTRELSPDQHRVIRAASLPVIALDPLQEEDSDVPTISSANWNGGMRATGHLIALGHRRIGFAAGPASSLPAREREMGYRSAVLEAGLGIDERLIGGDGYTYASGLEAASAMLALPPAQRPTAIMAVCDVVAMGVYEAARRAGLSVPEDLSVVGYDDTFLAECAAPPLTTIHQALETMGARAVEAVHDLAAGSARTIGSVQIPTYLVERASAAPPRTA
ncbi:MULTISPECIES: LacI family DNA-binding transcriptional regulator [unclassified Actinomyces]|uniref:LacI family DNA-binding transcriptional regulator n=1 Tax=unclassified Actinomyces TaxID=2609248 RepID=UPI0020177FCD|nr:MULTISPECIES: LacI family DNA-binding transcriptional regulator [unclassified Actinomyces]MCL3777154.1 LacI family DNA-binding transcriptional regulator [Actinomyces sp. AC-20-1]MCL3789022.1 LacI family DNA-binding transcriptional regulator [Actinomyces sp. 187325]MCL3791377.1 LacI family DNA-binding transcriptional regulator [Actinomyces sp. 186855]MCL3793912.1 LacI family DNA-binding transcriptional regulator [Actinomyces sp. 217892]